MKIKRGRGPSLFLLSLLNIVAPLSASAQERALDKLEGEWQEVGGRQSIDISSALVFFYDDNKPFLAAYERCVDSVSNLCFTYEYRKIDFSCSYRVSFSKKDFKQFDLTPTESSGPNCPKGRFVKKHQPEPSSDSYYEKG